MGAAGVQGWEARGLGSLSGPPLCGVLHSCSGPQFPQLQIKTRLGSLGICKSHEKLQSHKSRYLFLIRGITVSMGLLLEFMTPGGFKTTGLP